jgi:polysaccharide export outer membrane protein
MLVANHGGKIMRRDIRLVLLCCCASVMVAAAQEPAGQKPAQNTPPVDQGAPAKATEEAPPASPSAGPVPTIAPVDPTTFVIGAEDTLLIQVWREPEFSRPVLVRPDGKITLPLIKEIQASGRTPDQLANDLQKALAEYIKNPEVTVTVSQVNSKKYYITGEVGRPGAFPLVVPTRVLDALTSAGGFREFANTKKITILRNGERLKFNYKEVVKGKNRDQNILLENGDYIIVP